LKITPGEIVGGMGKYAGEDPEQLLSRDMEGDSLETYMYKSLLEKNMDYIVMFEDEYDDDEYYLVIQR
jgi:hypothetical protein